MPRVCVDGECVAVGCDGELGGDKREDKCRVCGGQRDSCNTIEGLLVDKVRLMNDDSKYLLSVHAVLKFLNTCICKPNEQKYGHF